MSEINQLKTFQPLAVSSKFAICGLPIRVDTYKNCSFGCKYCFANNRVIMEFEKNLQIGNIKSVEKRLDRIFNKGQFEYTNFLDTLIHSKYTWHCGGMSDPFQPCEQKYHVTRDLLKATEPYSISILFSTKTDDLYDSWGWLNPALHTFQLSVTNVYNMKSIEPNVPDIKSRTELFDKLKSAGFRVGIRIQPFIPYVSTLDIVKRFNYADHFTLEGLKIVPQNKEHKEWIFKTFNLSPEDFTQMGLLNLKPEIRLEMYKPFIEYFESHKISYSIADNDLHYMGNNCCCCGDKLVSKSTGFNNTFLTHAYGPNYDLDCALQQVKFSCVDKCKCNQLFTSNRQGGCVTVQDFFEKRFDRKSSPFSPKFLYFPNNEE